MSTMLCYAITAMIVYSFDPLRDPRWTELLEGHPRASIFHTPGWLSALRRTYEYEPVAFTTSPPNSRLTNGIPFSRIDSWLTGSRLVSVAFADHCQPLVREPDECVDLLRQLPQVCSRANYGYLELRVLNSHVPGLEERAGLANSESFAYHELDLQPDLEMLFRGLHPSCMQRKIRRAEREGLTYEAGKSDEMLKQFYSLLLLTRRRHGLPPQPFAWFRNLRDCLGDAFKIHVASNNRRPVASILTLRHKNALVYKYGCSDTRFHAMGGMPFLFWRAIQNAKALGLDKFDLGRSDADDHGLIAFKNHLGGTRSLLNYYRYPHKPGPVISRRSPLSSRICSYLPDFLLKAAGDLLYRHIG
ncbi:MAG: hypothetical protein C5B53_12350 [Candidatus Melainabacteria bacterium]|nr:MAG: hypothetical protein C5B53_12350 [Candidatus Melainabacteria bacterium]